MDIMWSEHQSNCRSTSGFDWVHFFWCVVLQDVQSNSNGIMSLATYTCVCICQAHFDEPHYLKYFCRTIWCNCSSFVPSFSTCGVVLWLDGFSSTDVTDLMSATEMVPLLSPSSALQYMINNVQIKIVDFVKYELFIDSDTMWQFVL